MIDEANTDSENFRSFEIFYLNVNSPDLTAWLFFSFDTQCSLENSNFLSQNHENRFVVSHLKNPLQLTPKKVLRGNFW